ncbi:MAG: Hsp33 family molecular chaperone HslO [Rhodospirillaceae bacterium]|nr:Hsp33 family molecular chaperone HslO [Rhodospirillaceae bacterium]
MTSRDDFVLPFALEGQPVRGRLVRLGPLVDDILGRHDYPKPVAGLLTEILTLAALLSDALKFEGVFSLQTKGDGPVRLMVADATSAGDMRAYAQFDEAAVARAAAGTSGPSLPRLTGPGYLAFTVDQGVDTDRYQGIVELNGETLVECIHHYFRQSEQIRTAIVVASSTDSAGQRQTAAIMIQRMPGPADATAAPEDELVDEDWRRACILLASVRREELNDRNLAPTDLLYRLFHEEGVRVFDERPLRAGCRCSRERVERTLAQLPHDELIELIEDNHLAVTCEFCNRTYRFKRGEIDALGAA